MNTDENIDKEKDNKRKEDDDLSWLYDEDQKQLQSGHVAQVRNDLILNSTVPQGNLPIYNANQIQPSVMYPMILPPYY